MSSTMGDVSFQQAKNIIDMQNLHAEHQKNNLTKCSTQSEYVNIADTTTGKLSNFSLHNYNLHPLWIKYI